MRRLPAVTRLFWHSQGESAEEFAGPLRHHRCLGWSNLGGEAAGRACSDGPEYRYKEGGRLSGRAWDGAGQPESGCARPPGATRIGAVAQAEASPSNPTSTVAPESISKRGWSIPARGATAVRRARRPRRASRRPSSPGCPERRAGRTGSGCWTPARAERCHIPSPRVAEAQVEGCRTRAEQVGQHFDDRAQLGIAVLRRLDDLAVEADRRVVHEDPTVDLGQVDTALGTVVEGVEGTDHIFPVHANVQCEVVTSAGRYADVGDVLLGGDGATIASETRRRPCR